MRIPAPTLDVPVAPLIRACRLEVHLRVTGARFAAARIWLGTWILRAAGAVIGCSISVEVHK